LQEMWVWPLVFQALLEREQLSRVQIALQASLQIHSKPNSTWGIAII